MVNNLIKCRVRAPKSSAEALRYSLENCAVEAKVMKAPKKKGDSFDESSASTVHESQQKAGKNDEENTTEDNMVESVVSASLHGENDSNECDDVITYQAF